MKTKQDEREMLTVGLLGEELEVEWEAEVAGELGGLFLLHIIRQFHHALRYLGYTLALIKVQVLFPRDSVQLVVIVVLEHPALFRQQ